MAGETETTGTPPATQWTSRGKGEGYHCGSLAGLLALRHSKEPCSLSTNGPSVKEPKFQNICCLAKKPVELIWDQRRQPAPYFCFPSTHLSVAKSRIETHRPILVWEAPLSPLPISRHACKRSSSPTSLPTDIPQPSPHQWD